MGVYQYLELSTGHLPHSEFKAIDGKQGERSDEDGVIADSYEFGVWVHVSFERDADQREREEKMRVAGFDVLPQLLDRARRQGCAWLRFDQDGDVDPDLPTFNW